MLQARTLYRTVWSLHCQCPCGMHVLHQPARRCVAFRPALQCVQDMLACEEAHIGNHVQCSPPNKHIAVLQPKVCLMHVIVPVPPPVPLHPEQPVAHPEYHRPYHGHSPHPKGPPARNHTTPLHVRIVEETRTAHRCRMWETLSVAARRCDGIRTARSSPLRLMAIPLPLECARFEALQRTRSPGLAQSLSRVYLSPFELRRRVPSE
jgi:hypothetical protein